MKNKNGGARVQCSPFAGQFPGLSSSQLLIITYENGETGLKKGVIEFQHPSCGFFHSS